ncbi:MAG: hypothetical protein WB696_07240 [Chthoniobacterales bacterium]
MSELERLRIGVTHPAVGIASCTASNTVYGALRPIIEYLKGNVYPGSTALVGCFGLGFLMTIIASVMLVASLLPLTVRGKRLPSEPVRAS